jgi:hypothetical protein
MDLYEKGPPKRAFFLTLGISVDFVLPLLRSRHDPVTIKNLAPVFSSMARQAASRLTELHPNFGALSPDPKKLRVIVPNDVKKLPGSFA